MEHRLVHFVLTRFNLDLDATSGLGETWLRKRVGLFQKFTLPSIRCQSTLPTRWLIYCDDGKGSPEWFRHWMDRALPAFGEVVVTHQGFSDLDYIQTSVTERIPAGSTRVVTTRLDNDDAVARDFCESIQSHAEEGAPRFVNFLQGAQYQAGRLYVRPDPANAFATLIEDVTHGQHIQTVYCVPHAMMSTVRPVEQVLAHPMWMQVVHGSNIANEIIGVRVPSKHVMRHFDLPVATDDRGMFTDMAKSSGRWLRILATDPRRVVRALRRAIGR